jgi:isoleucyl-tRNA synthetase
MGLLWARDFEHLWEVHGSRCSFFVPKIIKVFPDKELIKKKYKPVFDYFYNHNNAFSILPADFVTNKGGTAIVHIAPAFGEEDYELCKKHNISVVCPINDAGIFTSQVKDLEGVYIFDSADIVIKK